MNILFAVSEAAPFVKTGGLADVAGSLPAALAEADAAADVRVILPLYGTIGEKWRLKMNFLFYVYIRLSWRSQYCGVFTLRKDGVTYYFVDNEYYFKRERIYGEYDDGERFAFFSRAVVDLLSHLDWTPDIIHCNDWQTALVPIYLRQERGEPFDRIRTVFTIHNIEYQGRFDRKILGDVLGLSDELYNSGILRYDDDVNLMKGAIYTADRLTTVSPTYAQELRDPWVACGLHTVIRENAHKLSGILNGIDAGRYNPSTDPYLCEHYNADDLSGKRACRRDLCRLLGFDEADDGPIVACISRLVPHKGFDLVVATLEDMVAHGARLILLGTGDARYEDFFRDAENRHRGRVSANILYSEERSSKIYAGADLLLMPSRSEPCGLTQMIAMRYGTPPVVHAVGGLRDSVVPYPYDGSNGFTFSNYAACDLLGTVDYAMSIRQNTAEWKALQLRCMTADLSWSRSAKQYLDLYRALGA